MIIKLNQHLLSYIKNGKDFSCFFGNIMLVEYEMNLNFHFYINHRINIIKTSQHENKIIINRLSTIYPIYNILSFYHYHQLYTTINNLKFYLLLH